MLCKDLLKAIIEIFFLVCNRLVVIEGGSEPFGENSNLLFAMLQFISLTSGRPSDRPEIQTETMLVAVVGISKRCHEIANIRQDELQTRLQNDGSLPKKSDFIQILLSIWKDSIRILGRLFCSISCVIYIQRKRT